MKVTTEISDQDFVREIVNMGVTFTQKATIWGSQYWTIDGTRYRLSDHRKPESGYSEYEYGKNDFDTLSDMLEVVRANVREKNKVRHLSFEERSIYYEGLYCKENNLVEDFEQWANNNQELAELLSK